MADSTDHSTLRDTAAARPGTPRARRALIVDATPPDAPADARGTPTLASLLRDRGGFDVRVLAAADATRRAILAGLAWLAEGAAPGDTLFFVYEGAGSDPPTSSPLRDIEGFVQRLAPADAVEEGHIDHQQIYQRLIAPLPKGVRVLMITDTYHDGSLLELKNVVALQAVRQAGAPALPARVQDREYDNREWDVAVQLRRRGVYREPDAEVVAIAPGRIDGRASGERGEPRLVASTARAVSRACAGDSDPRGPSAFLQAPLVSICKHATAELQLAGGSADHGLLLSTTGLPLTALICTLA